MLQHNKSFIRSVIFLNIFVLALRGYDNSELLGYYLQSLNHAADIILTSEVFLRIVVQGRFFFYDERRVQFYNLLDLIVVALSTESWISGRVVNWNYLRVYSLYTNVRFLKGPNFDIMRRIVSTLRSSISSLIQVLNIFLLILFMYALVGSYLFANVIPQTHIGDTMNFKTFPNAFRLLSTICTGHDWQYFMQDASVQVGCEPSDGSTPSTCGLPTAAKLYFISFAFLCLWTTNIVVGTFLFPLEDLNFDEPMPVEKLDIEILSFKWARMTAEDRLSLVTRQPDLPPKPSPALTVFLQFGTSPPLNFHRDDLSYLGLLELLEIPIMEVPSGDAHHNHYYVLYYHVITQLCLMAFRTKVFLELKKTDDEEINALYDSATKIWPDLLEFNDGKVYTAAQKLAVDKISRFWQSYKKGQEDEKTNPDFVLNQRITSSTESGHEASANQRVRLLENTRPFWERRRHPRQRDTKSSVTDLEDSLDISHETEAKKEEKEFNVGHIQMDFDWAVPAGEKLFEVEPRQRKRNIADDDYDFIADWTEKSKELEEAQKHSHRA
jgi:hypothetical protein